MQYYNSQNSILSLILYCLFLITKFSKLRMATTLNMSFSFQFLINPCLLIVTMLQCTKASIEGMYNIISVQLIELYDLYYKFLRYEDICFIYCNVMLGVLNMYTKFWILNNVASYLTFYILNSESFKLNTKSQVIYSFK